MAIRKAYPPGAPVAYHGMAFTEKMVGPTAGVSITAADLGTSGNQVALFTVPAGFLLHALRIDTPQLDSGAGLTVSLGDAANPTRFLNASTAFRAATPNVTGAVLGVAGYKFPADTDLILTVTAAAATPVPGALIAYALGRIDA